MQSLEFKAKIDPAADFVDAVNFKTGRVSTETAPSYNTLTEFFGDLVRGYPFPLTLGLHRIDNVSSLVAMALFAHRELAIHPSTVGFVACVELFCSEPLWGPGHMDRDLAHFLKFLQRYISTTSSKRQLGENISTALAWIRSYILEGSLPQLPPRQPPPVVLDVGTNGFVIAEMPQESHVDGWWDLFRLGHLRGVLLGPRITTGCRRISLARKSRWTELNLAQAKHIFDMLESAAGNPSWVLDGNILLSPRLGTVIEPKHIVDVAIRL